MQDGKRVSEVRIIGGPYPGLDELCRQYGKNPADYIGFVLAFIPPVPPPGGPDAQVSLHTDAPDVEVIALALTNIARVLVESLTT